MNVERMRKRAEAVRSVPHSRSDERPEAKFCILCGTWVPWPTNWGTFWEEFLRHQEDVTFIPPHECEERSNEEVWEAYTWQR